MDSSTSLAHPAGCYRFRLASIENMPASAGNALAIVGTSAKPKVLACLLAHDLAQATPALRKVVAGTRGVQIFVRLNVARAVRETEHKDIIEAVHPDQILDDFD